VDAPPDTALARNQAARRRRVIEATLELVNEGGFDAVQMRDVAAAANVALGTVYRYFASKKRLLLQATAGRIDELAPRLRGGPRRGGPGAGGVVGVPGRGVSGLARRPGGPAAMVRSLGPARPGDGGAIRRCTAAMTGIITGAMPPGEPSPRDLVVARALQQI